MRQTLEPDDRAVRLALVHRGVDPERAVAMEEGARAAVECERAEVVVAQVEAHGREVRHAPRHVGAEPLALEVVPVVLAAEQQGQAVLDVLDLLQVAVIGAPRHGDTHGEPAGGQDRLLELDAVENALAFEGVLDTRADARQHRGVRLHLVTQPQPQAVHTIVVGPEARLAPAPVLRAPFIHVGEQVVAERRSQPDVLTREANLLVLGLHRGSLRVRRREVEAQRVGRRGPAQLLGGGGGRRGGAERRGGGQAKGEDEARREAADRDEAGG